MAEQNSGGIRPIQRDPSNDAEREAQDKLQQRLADRIRGSGSPAARNAALTTNTLLTTKEHLGKRAAEPHKPDEQEALKVGSALKVGPRVDTVEISAHPSGEATDTLVVSTGSEASLNTPNVHTHDAIGIGQTRAEALGEGKEKNGENGGQRQPIVRTHEVVGEVKEGEIGEPLGEENESGGGKGEPEPVVEDARFKQREGESDEDFRRRVAESKGEKVD